MDYHDTSAVISECGRYRYRLSRVWNPDKRPCVWVMLNPSTADASQDDPTIRKCVGFADRWGCGGITVVNLYALRSTDPDELDRHQDPVGPDNDSWISRSVRDASIVVCGWGQSFPIGGQDRITQVVQLIHQTGASPMCVGVTASGNPRHPLYVPYRDELRAYSP